MLTKEISGDNILYKSGSTTVLTVEESLTEQGALIRFAGELRGDVAHSLNDELIAFISSNVDITLDMEGVVYIANSIQEVLLHIQQCIDQKGSGRMVLKHLQPAVLQAFQNTGMIDCLDIV